LTSDETSAISEQLKGLTAVSERLRLDLEAALDDAKTQLMAEVQAQSVVMKNFIAASNHDQTCSKHYYDLLGSLPSTIHQLVQEAQKIKTSQQILRNMRSEGLTHREGDIKDAHAKTFMWIFEDDTTSFKRWLTSDDRVFWINGKAGSGKSTLMKFLANHKETKALLRHWSGNEDLIIASFYFWGAGHESQKSQLGLLKGLLYQIILQCPNLIPSVWSSRWDTGNAFDNSFDHWTRQELTDAVVKIIACGSLKSKFCFFVDGLDEYADAYAGEHHALIEFLDHLAQSSHVKMCVSSRPWNVFKDRYDKHNDLKFILQDLTSGDMLKFAQGLLQDDERFRRLSSRDPEALSLAIRIRDKAEGVFLWVFLVTRSLQRGLSDRDGMEELERRLARIPSDLFEYYWSIFESIDDNYKDYTMRALQIAAIALPMPLAAFQYIPQEVEDHTYAIRQQLDVQAYATGPLGRKPQDGGFGIDLLSFFPPTIPESDVEVKVNKWCRDLLEVHHSKQGWKKPHPSVLRGQVQFLHRTVKDFLLKQNMQDLFQKSSVCVPSPRKAVCRMYLAYTKSCCGTIEPDSPDEPYSLEANTNKVLRWARLCEIHDRRTPLDLLNELERIRLAVQSARGYEVESRESMLRLAVQEDLLLYVETIPGRDVRAEPGILWAALFPKCKDRSFPTHYPRPYPENLAMISKLLEKGCSPNDAWTADDTQDKIEKSVWQMLMGQLYESRTTRHHNPPEQPSQLVETSHIVAFLLIHGADPDAKFQHRLSRQRIWSNTDDFLMHVFKDDRAKVDALQKEARKVRAAALAKDGGFFAGFMGWSA
jgi:hypothetical protein